MLKSSSTSDCGASMPRAGMAFLNSDFETSPSPSLSQERKRSITRPACDFRASVICSGIVPLPLRVMPSCFGFGFGSLALSVAISLLAADISSLACLSSAARFATFCSLCMSSFAVFSRCSLSSSCKSSCDWLCCCATCCFASSRSFSALVSASFATLWSSCSCTYACRSNSADCRAAFLPSISLACEAVLSLRDLSSSF
mmetsp:Transcript_19710/g.50200  ORF Transcript_19710/g.50200 Transcript_19710/m.50200 type:complete len:200 (+) Transcript_19710:667-1266(+)